VKVKDEEKMLLSIFFHPSLFIVPAEACRF